MTSHVSRRWMLAGLLAGAAAPVLADAPATSPRPRPRPGLPAGAAVTRTAAAPASAPAAEALIDAAKLGGRLGYAVLDARSGALLESRLPDLALPPASVAKAVTAAYALERLGPGFRFATRVVAAGSVQGGTVQGDLVLLGSGDPTLSTDQLGELAQTLRAKGIKGITGRLLVNGSAMPRIPRIDAGQPDHVGYNPAISGLNLNFNRVHFEWKRGQGGWQVGVDARGERFVPAVRMARVRIAQREAPLFTYTREGEQENWTVASASLGKGGSRWLPTRQPELYAGEVFQTLCAAQGIRLPAPQLSQSQPGGTVLAQVSSKPLTDMAREMLRHSTNLTAEVLGLSASGASSLEGSAGRMSEWLASRLGARGRFVDHSGLGGASRISAQDMAAALARAPHLRDLMRPFATRDKSKGAGPQVLAKTGTLNFVSGLAGFVETGGRPLVFAIFAADTARREGLRGAEREAPQGGPQWTRRARGLQGQLIERWAKLYA